MSTDDGISTMPSFYFCRKFIFEATAERSGDGGPNQKHFA
jgi:hypothetical protein